MNIPECYGTGIYEYWKIKKDSIKLLANGIAQDDPIFTLFGILLTAFSGVRDVLNLLNDKSERIILPKDDCSNCRVLKGCLLSAIFLLGDEINEELKEKWIMYQYII